MDTTIEKILEQALEMPPKDRAAIAERLILSLDVQADSDVEATWQREIRQRVAEIEKGEVVCIPWDTVRERLRKNPRETG
jgi:putative addiction module component (TIGR02574 family)